MGAGDAFPSTQHTFIGRLIESGRPTIAAEHIMAIYARPLEIYLKGSTFRTVGEASDVVRGFFADRLTRDDFLRDWLESRRQLRHWLITAFRHYLLEQARGDRRAAAPAALDPDALAAGDRSAGAEATFHREAALTMVREALRLAEDACRQAGFEDHWRVFVRHHIDGRNYEQLRAEFGLDTGRFRVMARTAGNKLRTALRELIAWPGAREREIDTEIQALMEAIRP